MDELPETLSRAGFTCQAGAAQGLSASVLRSSRFVTPYRGIRTVEKPESLLACATAFAPLLRPWQALGGVSALSTLGLPVPWRLGQSTDVELISLRERGRPVRDGVRVRRIADDLLDVTEVEGVRTASAPLAWALMGGRCTVHELVVLGDAIVTGFKKYPGRRLPGPLSTLADLRAIAERWKGLTGAKALRLALARIRERVESPRETDMRLFIVDAGMPEPEVQVEVHDPGTGLLLGRADCMHREARVVEEYEGEHHRSKQQWDRDIQKYRAFERVGLRVVRATNRDLVPSPDRWLADLAAVLQRRS